MKERLLTTCKILWIIALIIFAIIVLIMELNVIQWLQSFININDFVIMITNLILAICAILALANWKKELNKKRQFDIVDELLVLIIKTQTFLKEDFLFYRVGSKDTKMQEENIPKINRKAILYGKEFELLYSRLMTVGLQDFANKTKNIASKFTYSIKNDNGTYNFFYESCLDATSNFGAEIVQELSELRTMCEKKIFV